MKINEELGPLILSGLSSTDLLSTATRNYCKKHSLDVLERAWVELYIKDYIEQWVIFSKS